MSKTVRLFLLGAAFQSSAIIGFVMLAASEMAFAKPVPLALAGIGLLWVFLQLAEHRRWLETIWFHAGLGALAVCTQQLLGFSFYPGLLKDVRPMTIEHAQLTFIVLALITLIYWGGYGLVRGALFLWSRRTSPGSARGP